MTRFSWIYGIGSIVFLWTHALAAQETTTVTPEMQKRYDAFAECISETKFVGSFSVTGRDQPMTKEEYYIASAKKLDEGDLWVITARIKYGTNDLTVPMTMEVKFAGETPVITVDQMTIPGFGTFDARVLVNSGQYAGTWKHGEVGGHLIGDIVKLTEQEREDLNIRSRRKKTDDQ